MAAALGAGSRATFALVALMTPAARVGPVTGVVGAAGGLGGFLPPLVMGSPYGAYASYALGLALVAVVAAAALAYTLTAVRAAAEGDERTPLHGPPERARHHRRHDRLTAPAPTRRRPSRPRHPRTPARPVLRPP
ncbi:hypothetical protein [Streptomyces sp. HM190]|uniref:hypothetical protein n=1 Tax=Streptomyces sp. HM190 TaxID=2695266 RepID=UPI002E2CD7A0|nr:hypothetical protein [Streptomyces sp. HM190]